MKSRYASLVARRICLPRAARIQQGHKKSTLSSSASSSLIVFRSSWRDYENYTQLLSRRHVHVESHKATYATKNSSRQRRRSRGSAGGTSSSSEHKQRLVDRQNIPSYKEFVHRFTVLSLYRNFFKTLYRANVHNEQELKQQIRHEFKTHRHDQDPFNIQRALAEGKRRLEELQDFTGQNNSKYEQDMASWINIQDEEDPRGRVGQGWPWQK